MPNTSHTQSDSPEETRRDESQKVKVDSISDVSGGEINIAGHDIRSVEAGTYIERAIYMTPDSEDQAKEDEAPEPPEPPEPGEPPFKGLQYFDIADADIFFGRELLITKLIRQLFEHRFLAVVVGASGSGKSSIVRAGIISAIQRGEPLADGALLPEGSTDWPIHLITPTVHPLEALAASLTRESESVTPIDILIDDMMRSPRGLHLHIRKILSDISAKHLLIIIDQFEELFTLCRSEVERKKFVDNLLTAVSEDTGGLTFVLIALRADFYAHCAQYANLRVALTKHQEYIGPMEPEELRRAIEEPAKRGNWEFEPGLVNLLLQDISDEPGYLPLLSHALLETWKQRRGRTLTLQGYTDAGGVRGAIAKTAENVYQNLSDEHQKIARNIFLRLTELGEGTPDTRRRARLSELIHNPEDKSIVETVLKKLVDARLIITSEGVIEVAHEALIREWPTLRQWLAENREWLRFHRQITQAAQEWLTSERDESALYRGSRLAVAMEWTEENDEELSPLEREFLKISHALQTRELDEAKKKAEQLRNRAIYLALALVVALIAAFAASIFERKANITAAQNATLAEQNAQIASTAVEEANMRATAQAQTDEQRQIALSRQLAAQATNYFNSRYDLALLLSLEAVRINDSPEVKSSLLSGLEQNPNLVAFMSAYTNTVYGVALSPDGKVLASGSQDGKILLWDFETRQFNGSPLIGHSDKVIDLEFSEDGKTLVSASEDKTVAFWDVASREQIDQSLSGHTGAVTSVALSPDGKLLASSSYDGSIIFWDAASHRLIDRLVDEHENRIYQAVFNPSGDILASSSSDNTITLWDSTTHQPIGESLQGHTDRVYAVAFNPDGKTLVSGSDDNLVIFWDVATHKQIGEPVQFSSAVTELTFNSDGSMLAIGSGNRIYLWNVDTHELIPQPITGQPDPINHIIFSPDDRTLISNGYRAVILWNVTPNQRLGSILDGHIDWVRSVVFSPDGKLLASGSIDHTIILWDVHTHQQFAQLKNDTAVSSLAFSLDNSTLYSGGQKAIRLWDVATHQLLAWPLEGHTNWVRSMSMRPDGKVMASGSYDGKIILWDLTTYQSLKPSLTDHTGQVYAVAYSPDGRILASGGEDNTIILWNTDSYQPIGQPLVGHNNLVLSLAFSPDGRTLASSSADKTIILWDVETQSQLAQPLIGHNSWVFSVIFSPDGKILASGSGDNTVILWDMTLHRIFGSPLTGHTDRVWKVAFSPDGKTLASGSGDNTVVLWDIDLESWQNQACLISGRNFTQDEWEQFLPNEPYRATCPQFSSGK